MVVNLLPYSTKTICLINADWLAGMKRGAMLVSWGSGGTIDEQALADAMHSGQIAGAAMDSFSREPLQADNPLVTLAREGANILPRRTPPPEMDGHAPQNIPISCGIYTANRS